jgi:hypothetical protein
MGVRWIEERTVCLFHLSPGGNPVPMGTGVLLRVANAGFILTAAHVIGASQKDQGLRILVAPNINNLGLIDLVGASATRSLDIDNVDAAIIRLPPYVDAELAEHKRFVRLSEVAAERTPTGGCYNVMGYPREWAKVDVTTMTMSLVPVCYGTDLHLGRLASSVEGLTIVLDFPPGGYEQISGAMNRMPLLNGISGSGIWRMYGPENVFRLDTWDPSWIQLAGIEHTVVSRKAIKGVIIRHVLVYIASRWPDMRAAINLIRSP